MYEIRNLSNVGLEEIAETWTSAFSDYIVSTTVTTEDVKAYFKISGVDRSMSFGAFYDDTLVGMLINSIDDYRGMLVAYDAMTGIVPEHRGRGIFSLLFEHTRNALKSNGITHYYLEVITKNESAYKIYEKKGAKVCREFSVVEGRISCDCDFEVNVIPLKAVPQKDLSKYEPSFSNRITALFRNADCYQIAYIENENRKTSVIFNERGGISQIMFDGARDEDLLKGVLAYLSRDFEVLRISNIPTTETELIDELLKLGFSNLVNQYEMLIAL